MTFMYVTVFERHSAQTFRLSALQVYIIIIIITITIFII